MKIHIIVYQNEMEVFCDGKIVVLNKEQDLLQKLWKELSGVLTKANVFEADFELVLNPSITERKPTLPMHITTILRSRIRGAEGNFLFRKHELYQLSSQMVLNTMSLIFWSQSKHFEENRYWGTRTCRICRCLQHGYVSQFQPNMSPNKNYDYATNQCTKKDCYSHTLGHIISSSYRIDDVIIEADEFWRSVSKKIRPKLKAMLSASKKAEDVAPSGKKFVSQRDSDLKKD